MKPELPGIFALYKPVGPSSNQVLGRLRKLLNIKKIGYAGTLDPLAEGVLVMAVGRENTKQLRHILEQEKEYVATIRFGFTSTTDDEEGEKTPVAAKKIPTRADIEAVLPEFIGSIWQMPPAYSAIKTGGQRAYAIARSGGTPLLGKRNVDIYSIDIAAYDWPLLTVTVRCGAGTYIRSLARDIGYELGCGGYLAGLIRTRVGEYTADTAYTLKAIADADV
jgi:tRNA pseudouridine55 synthase